MATAEARHLGFRFDTGAAPQAGYEARFIMGGAGMKEYPILFTGPMVRAILEGRKTMTRRVAFHRWGQRNQCDHTEVDVAEPAILRHCTHGSGYTRCPYGQPGDRLWVRAAWNDSHDGYIYRADVPDEDTNHVWRPSIHMSRCASRIILEVTAARVVRVLEVSDQDADAEGIERNWVGNVPGWNPTEHGYIGTPWPENDGDDAYFRTAREAFQELWDSINAKRGYGWDYNPWVWVVSFRRIKDLMEKSA
jgi:hypothetical protein